MRATPAVVVRAGRNGGLPARAVSGWPSVVRSALLRRGNASVIALGVVACLAFSSIAVTAAPNSLPLRASYRVRATINAIQGSLTVASTARIRNTTRDPVDRLTFNLLPLRLGHAELGRVTVRGKRVTPIAYGQSVVVPLPRPLKPRESIHVTIAYRALFNTTTRGKRSLFTNAEGVITAYRWIPWLSRAQKFAAPNFGETWVTAVSPRVVVTVRHDVPMTFATSGRRASGNAHKSTFIATNVRDFNFAASADYKLKRVTWRGIGIEFHYRGESPDRIIRLTIRALTHFTRKIGPYPYNRLSIAESPAGVGMESPALTWIDTTIPEPELPYVIAHELAHQWFYGAVGNNQAATPFLDEALADFLARDLLSDFRRSECAKARLDKSVYEYSARCYAEVIYVQGGLYLDRYKTEVGHRRFWKGLSQFYRDWRLRITGTSRLLDALDEATGYDSNRHADRFPSLYP